ncbi:hypothetical protein NE865_12174 [Phthorimaea operculella]|nr:hypothetical protein NE865_12174 [Phthorimaea operculella]
MTYLSLDMVNEIDNFFNIDCHACCTLEDSRQFLDGSYNFKILTFNIRSIQANFDQFTVALRRLEISYDIIILTECRLAGGAIVGQIPGYTAFSTINNKNQNGGVVAYIKDKWNATVTEPDFPEAECLNIELFDSVVIMGIYRSPSYRNLESFFSSLNNNLELYKRMSTVLLAGDININILNSNDEDVIEYLNLLAEADLFPGITLPTRYGSCLDHIFVKTISDHIVGVVPTTGITDHKIAMVGLDINTEQVKNNCNNRYVTQIDYPAAALALENSDWSPVLEATDVNSAVSEFSRILCPVIKQNSKIKRICRSRYVLKPWITPGLIRCMKHRDKLHLDARNNPNDTFKATVYKRYRNFFTELLHKLKNDYDSQKFEEAKNDPKQVWKTIDKTCERPKRNNPATELTKCLPGNPNQSLNHCNEYFANVGRNLASQLLQKMNTSRGHRQ